VQGGDEVVVPLAVLVVDGDAAVEELAKLCRAEGSISEAV
jgi:hypothetical protein